MQLEFTSYIVSLFFTVIVACGIYYVIAPFYVLLFKKANTPTWKAWVPFVREWKFLELGGIAGWISLVVPLAIALVWVLFLVCLSVVWTTFYQAAAESLSSVAWLPLNSIIDNPQSYLGFIPAIVPVYFFISVLSVLPNYIAANNIGLKLNKNGLWTLLYILLPPIWLAIVAFDHSTWNDMLGTPAQGR
jgi:hypothetical protein